MSDTETFPSLGIPFHRLFITVAYKLTIGSFLTATNNHNTDLLDSVNSYRIQSFSSDNGAAQTGGVSTTNANENEYGAVWT